MFIKLLLLFTLVPFLELFILFQLGDSIGWFSTLTLIVVTGIIGTTLARQQGFLVWRKMQQEMSQGQPPTASLVEGMLILLAGLLLLTPGVLTDVCGFLLLWAPARKLAMISTREYLSRRAHVKAAYAGTHSQQNTTYSYSQSSPPEHRRPTHDAQGREIIDVEFTKKVSS